MQARPLHGTDADILNAANGVERATGACVDSDEDEEVPFTDMLPMTPISVKMISRTEAGRVQQME